MSFISLDARDALEGNTGLEQALEVDLVRVFLQEKNVLSHDEAPDSVIDRGVFVVTLIDRELEQMFGECSHGRTVHWDSTFSFHRYASKDG